MVWKLIFGSSFIFTAMVISLPLFNTPNPSVLLGFIVASLILWGGYFMFCDVIEEMAESNVVLQYLNLKRRNE